MLLPITLTFAAATALLSIWLGIRTARLRAAHKILHGDGGNVALMRRMRAHSNYIEYTPFVVILMGLIEMARGTSTWLWLVALAYIIGRVLHAFGMDKDFASKLRGIGILISWLTLIGLAAVALYSAYVPPRHALPSVMGAHV